MPKPTKAGFYWCKDWQICDGWWVPVEVYLASLGALRYTRANYDMGLPVSTTNDNDWGPEIIPPKEE